MIYAVSWALQGANHEKAPLIHPFDPRKGMPQMDSLDCVNVECKCFVVGCNNSATTYARIELSDRIDGLIRVCHSCLPVIQSNETQLMEVKKK
jgi:hypothetical protein